MGELHAADGAGGSAPPFPARRRFTRSRVGTAPSRLPRLSEWKVSRAHGTRLMNAVPEWCSQKDESRADGPRARESTRTHVSERMSGYTGGTRQLSQQRGGGEFMSSVQPLHPQGAVRASPPWSVAVRVAPFRGGHVARRSLHGRKTRPSHLSQVTEGRRPTELVQGDRLRCDATGEKERLGKRVWRSHFCKETIKAEFGED